MTGSGATPRTEFIDGSFPPDFVASEWDALGEAAGTPNIFYERWVATPSAALPEAAGLLLLLVWRDDPAPHLIGLLPLQRPRRVGAPLQNWEQRVRALGEPLILPGEEHAFWRGALGALDPARLGAWLRLSALIADSASTRALTALLDARRRPWSITRSHHRALLRGGEAAAAYKRRHVRGKVLKEHRRLLNRLADRGVTTVGRLGGDDDPAPWIDTLFELELSGWKGREGVAAASDPAAERCFRAILAEAHTRGRLDCSRLALDGRAISMLATIEAHAGHAFAIKIAYDEAHASSSPGVLLEMAWLDHALDVRKLSHVDSCAREEHPMIDRIWADRLTIVSLALPFDRTSSKLVYAVQAGARRLRDRLRRRRKAPAEATRGD